MEYKTMALEPMPYIYLLKTTSFTSHFKMINFCKKSFNTLFNTASTISPPGEDSSANHHHITPLPVTNCDTGLNVLITSGKSPKPKNVTVSSLTNSPVKSDQIETGLKVLNSGDIDRLASCTESLGFESCNERSINNNFYSSEKSRANEKSRKFDKKNKGIKNKSFPPPLSSFNGNGKPEFFLRPVRNNGRLKLTEVKINRPERLRASREDGRLRLNLVESEYKSDDVITSTDHVVGDKLGDDMDKKIVKELKFPGNIGGGEDCRWLREMANNHHHHQHNMHGWGALCQHQVKSQ